MAKAICIKCGALKRAAWQICSNCSFDPRLDENSLIKSIYLSVGRFSNDENPEYQYELDIISEKIMNGLSINYDPKCMRRIKKESKMFKTVPWHAPWIVILKVFGPIFGIIIAFVIIRRLI